MCNSSHHGAVYRALNYKIQTASKKGIVKPTNPVCIELVPWCRVHYFYHWLLQIMFVSIYGINQYKAMTVNYSLRAKFRLPLAKAQWQKVSLTLCPFGAESAV